MTGQAGLLDIRGKVQGKGLMGIGVAGKTIFQGKMLLTLVAHGTLRYDVLAPRWMLLMTIKTRYLRLMLTAIVFNCCRLVQVALHAVGHLQWHQPGLHLVAGGDKHHARYESCAEEST